MSIRLPDGTLIAGVGRENTENMLPLTGGTMRGVLILAGNPTQNLEAVPKQYLDSKIGDLGEVTSVNEYVDTQINNAIRWKTMNV